MAVAVPLIMGAAGASTLATVATTLVLGATGINAKIDKAASKVFGEDLVKIGNIAGAAFMAWDAFGGGAASSTPDAFSVGDAFGVGGPADPTSPFAVDAGGLVEGAGGATPPGSGVLDSITNAGKSIADKWSTMKPATQGALLQVGGNLLAGYGQAKAADKRAEEERKYDSKYRSGSGLPYWAKGALAQP